MKQLFIMLITLAGVITFTACNKEEKLSLEHNTNTKGLNLIRIEKAQQWLAANQSYTKSESIWATQWEDAFTQERDSTELVEIPLSFKSEKIILTTDCQDAFKSSGESKYLHNQTRLIVEYNTNSNLTRGFFMTIVPSKQYLEKTNFNLQRNSYCYRDSDFDGMVVYRDLTLNLLCGWVYKNGKIKDYIHPDLSLHITKAPPSSSETFCQTEYIVHYTEWRYNNSSRVDYQHLYTEEYTTCWTRGGMGGQRGELPPENGDGGGSVEFNPYNEKFTLETYPKWRFDAESLDTIAPVLTALKNHCVGEKVINTLLNKPIGFEYRANQLYMINYNTGSNIISWDINEYEKLNGFHLIEELVHGIQVFSGAYNRSHILNNEIEAKMLSYLYAKYNNEAQGLPADESNWENTFGAYLQSPTEQSYEKLINFLREKLGYKNNSLFPENSAFRNFNGIRDILKDCFNIQNL